MKQNASLDASFWINCCAAQVADFIADYFSLFVPTTVAEEIRYPLTVLGIKAYSPLLFNQWVFSGSIQLVSVQAPVDWYQKGENAAIALALEHGYWILMDDANPYHRARSVGLTVIGSCEFIVLLFDHQRLQYTEAVEAITRINASKGQKRQALTFLEMLARRKGSS